MPPTVKSPKLTQRHLKKLRDALGEELASFFADVHGTEDPEPEPEPDKENM